MNLNIGVLAVIVSLGLTDGGWTQRAVAGNGSPGFSFVTQAFVVSETEGIATITVMRGGGGLGTAGVDYHTSNGTASAGLDYAAVSGTLNFGPMETMKSFSISIQRDGLVESEETVHLTLSHPTGGLGLNEPFEAVLTIHDYERLASLDFSFAPGVMDCCASVDGLAVLSDGRVFVTEKHFGGHVGDYSLSFDRLNADGSPDTTFDPNLREGRVAGLVSRVLGSLLLPDGKLLVFGYFITMADGIFAGNLLRLNSDGSLETTLIAGDSCTVLHCVAQQQDGKLLIGGAFWGGCSNPPGPPLVRLNMDGSIDQSFQMTNDDVAPVLSILPLPDGKIIAFGWPGMLLRFNPDGSLDTDFRPVIIPNFLTPWAPPIMLAQPDGKVLVGLYDPESQQGHIVRLKPDGSRDMSFVPRIGGYIRSMTLQPDGKLLVATFSGLVRLDSDGSLDPSFDSPRLSFGVFPPSVSAIALVPDGSILIGGAFSSVNGVPRGSVARLHGDANFVRLNLPERTTNGSVRVTLSSQPGSRYALQGSSNLVGWAWLSTNSATGYSLTLEDPDPSGFSRRFYRAVKLEQ